MPHTYLLRCADGSYYVGSTRFLDERLRQHASGKGSKYTASRLPVELVWAQEFDDIGAAYALERKIHGWGRAKREALIRGDFETIHQLSRRGRRAGPDSGSR